MDALLASHTVPVDAPVAFLNCTTAFSKLTEREKNYAHHLSRAAWYGALVVPLQVSWESPPIFSLLMRLFSGQPQAQLKEACRVAGATEVEYAAMMAYAANLFGNMGNYNSFGDSKFVPGVPADRLELILKQAAGWGPEMETLWSDVRHSMYSLTARELQLGLGAQQGVSTYYSANCEVADAEAVQRFLDEKHIVPYNTRVFKHVDADGHVTYEVRLASLAGPESAGPEDRGHALLGTFPLGNGSNMRVVRGDHSRLFELVVKELEEARKYCANPTEEAMLDCHIRHFRHGNIEDHKDASRLWIRNKSPPVETYIGFIESYRDPYGVRGEWRSWVAMVNREQSAKFGTLVGNAQDYLKLLPWGPEFEKDVFLQPDFTSLEVLSFAGSSIPAGTNIPNYDDIRQNEGFKNVQLGNVASARSPQGKVSFIPDGDQALFKRWSQEAFEVQVGLHELLGHGSGKMFCQEADGSLNFAAGKVVHPDTGAPVDTYYLPGETWDAKFPVIASAYEECRAECVGLYLCSEPEVQAVFGHHGADADDCMYINWLSTVRAGVAALEMYTPSTKAWRQAHSRARYGMVQVLLDAAQGLVTIDIVTNPEDGRPDLRISVDRSKIVSVGRPAIGDFLRRLQVYKAVADVGRGKAMFEKYTAVGPDMLALREIVLARKKPRDKFCQANTSLGADGVPMVHEYQASGEGMVESFLARYSPWPEYEARLLHHEHQDRPMHVL